MSLKLKREFPEKGLVVCSYGEEPSITTSVHTIEGNAPVHVEPQASKTDDDADKANAALAKRVKDGEFDKFSPRKAKAAVVSAPPEKKSAKPVEA